MHIWHSRPDGVEFSQGFLHAHALYKHRVMQDFVHQHELCFGAGTMAQIDKLWPQALNQLFNNKVSKAVILN